MRVIILALFLTACGSSQKEIESEHKVVDVSADKPILSETKVKSDSKSSDPLTDAIRSGDNDKIISAAHKNLSEKPSDVRSLNALGLVYYKKGLFQTSQMFFSKGIQLKANSSELWNNIALTHLALKDQRSAVSAFKKALEISSQDGIAAANLGTIYLNERNFKKARSYLELAVKKNKKDFRLLNNLGIALSSAGDFSQAKSMYEDALKLSPGNKVIQDNLAILKSRVSDEK